MHAVLVDARGPGMQEIEVVIAVNGTIQIVAMLHLRRHKMFTPDTSIQ